MLKQVHMKKYRIEDTSWVAIVSFGDFSRPKKISFIVPSIPPNINTQHCNL